jgi:hypothetical protein
MVLLSVLFSVYLEEAIRSSQKLENVRSRGGDLLAFVDGMLVMSKSHPEIDMIINEVASLIFNKKKPEILTSD